MNFRIYIMAIATVAVGLVELVVGGILPVMADDLGVSLGQAGQLIGLFALVYAVCGPLLYVLTSRFERKKLYLASLLVFCLGNFFTWLSDSFTLIMLARVITAASTSLVVILSLTLTANLVAREHQAKAIGVIYMGISSSLVLGVPLGVIVAERFGWRVIFLGIGLLGLLSMLLIALTLKSMQGQAAMPLRQQLGALKNTKLLSAHLATLLMLAGHFTLYAYFTPFLQEQLQLDSSGISLAYFAFGVAAVAGGLLGGMLADRLGRVRTILLVLIAFMLSLLLLPFTLVSLWIFAPMMMLWGGLSWALSPALQSYLIHSDSSMADVQQSFNSSAIQAGISLGTGVGSAVLAWTGSTQWMAWVGAGVVLLALCCALYSIRQPVLV